MEDKTLEIVFQELDEVVKALEGEAVSLEDSFKLYHKGMDLLKVCNEKIDTVEKKMLQMSENGELSEF